MTCTGTVHSGPTTSISHWSHNAATRPLVRPDFFKGVCLFANHTPRVPLRPALYYALVSLRSRYVSLKMSDEPYVASSQEPGITLTRTCNGTAIACYYYI